nr:hypothetical protein [Tanacetum cinerariifolium]
MTLYNALPRKEYERVFMCKTTNEWQLSLLAVGSCSASGNSYNWQWECLVHFIPNTKEGGGIYGEVKSMRELFKIGESREDLLKDDIENLKKSERFRSEDMIEMKKNDCRIYRGILGKACAIFLAVALLFFWQWQLSLLAVGSCSASGNSYNWQWECLVHFIPNTKKGGGIYGEVGGFELTFVKVKSMRELFKIGESREDLLKDDIENMKRSERFRSEDMIEMKKNDCRIYRGSLGKAWY